MLASYELSIVSYFPPDKTECNKKNIYNFLSPQKLFTPERVHVTLANSVYVEPVLFLHPCLSALSNKDRRGSK
jgi:hypothetical protein